MTYIPEALRDTLKNQAQMRCQYCLLHEDNSYFPHEIDHIFAEKHGGETVIINLCLACTDCNLYKGSDLCSLDPLTGDIVPLFHPKQDRWNEHFKLENNGLIEPLSA